MVWLTFAWYHPVIVVFVGHWMMMVLLLVQLLVELISKHYPPKNPNVTSKGTVSKGKLSCNQHFFGDILVLRGSRNHLMTTFWEVKTAAPPVTIIRAWKPSWWIAKKSRILLASKNTGIEYLQACGMVDFPARYFFWFLTSWRFQPGSKIWVKWIISPGRVENTKCLKPPQVIWKSCLTFCQFLLESISTPQWAPSCQMNSSMQVLLHDHLQLSVRDLRARYMRGIAWK